MLRTNCGKRGSVWTAYASLFNTNPFFDDADAIIVDDVHAGESYVAGLWSIRVERTNPEQKALHAALRNVIKPHLDLTTFSRLEGKWDSAAERRWTDKLPTPQFKEIQSEIGEVLDAHVAETDLRHSWSLIREHLSVISPGAVAG
jgi:hypothetical protein